MHTPQTSIPQDNNLRLWHQKNIHPIMEKLFTQSCGQRKGILQQFICDFNLMNIIKAVCKNSTNKELCSYIIHIFCPRFLMQVFLFGIQLYADIHKKPSDHQCCLQMLILACNVTSLTDSGFGSLNLCSLIQNIQFISALQSFLNVSISTVPL